MISTLTKQIKMLARLLALTLLLTAGQAQAAIFTVGTLLGVGITVFTGLWGGQVAVKYALEETEESVPGAGTNGDTSNDGHSSNPGRQHSDDPLSSRNTQEIPATDANTPTLNVERGSTLSSNTPSSSDNTVIPSSDSIDSSSIITSGPSSTTGSNIPSSPAVDHSTDTAGISSTSASASTPASITPTSVVTDTPSTVEDSHTLTANQSPSSEAHTPSTGSQDAPEPTSTSAKGFSTTKMPKQTPVPTSVLSNGNDNAPDSISETKDKNTVKQEYKYSSSADFGNINKDLDDAGKQATERDLHDQIRAEADHLKSIQDQLRAEQENIQKAQDAVGTSRSTSKKSNLMNLSEKAWKVKGEFFDGFKKKPEITPLSEEDLKAREELKKKQKLQEDAARQQEADENAARQRKAPKNQTYSSSKDYADQYQHLRGDERVKQEDDLHQSIADDEKLQKERQDEAIRQQILREEQRVNEMRDADKVERNKRRTVFKQEQQAKLDKQKLEQEQQAEEEANRQTNQQEQAGDDTRTTFADDLKKYADEGEKRRQKVTDRLRENQQRLDKEKLQREEAIRQQQKEADENAARQRKAPKNQTYSSSKDYADQYQHLRGDERVKQEDDLHQSIADDEKLQKERQDEAIRQQILREEQRVNEMRDADKVERNKRRTVFKQEQQAKLDKQKLEQEQQAEEEANRQTNQQEQAGDDTRTTFADDLKKYADEGEKRRQKVTDRLRENQQRLDKEKLQREEAIRQQQKEADENAARQRKAPKNQTYSSSKDYADQYQHLRGDERVKQEDDLHQSIADDEKPQKERQDEAIRQQILREEQRVNEMRDADKVERNKRRTVFKQEQQAKLDKQKLEQEQQAEEEANRQTNQQEQAGDDTRTTFADDLKKYADEGEKRRQKVTDRLRENQQRLDKEKLQREEAIRQQQKEADENAARQRKAPKNQTYSSSKDYADQYQHLRGDERVKQEDDLHQSIADDEKLQKERQDEAIRQQILREEQRVNEMRDADKVERANRRTAFRKEQQAKAAYEARTEFADELKQYAADGDKKRQKITDRLRESQQRLDEERQEKEKREALDKKRENFFKNFTNRFKKPQEPVPNKPEDENENEEEPETPSEDEPNEDFINRNEEFEEELNKENDKDDNRDKPKGRKPTGVPKLNATAETHLQGSRALTHGSALMTMETMSGFRNAMGLYRSGRAFSFGTASLDNVSSRELLASNDPVHQLPSFNREIGSWHNFVQVHGIKANRNQVTGLPGGFITGQGMTAGVFYQLDTELLTGMLLSVHKNSYSFDQDLGSGSLENVRIGPFMSWTRGDFHLDASLTLAHNNYTLKRKDSAGNNLKASFSGHEVSAYTGMGYDVHLDSWAQGLTLTPMAELLYVRSQNAGYTEEGASDEAMKVNGGSGNQLIVRYGMEAGYLFPNLDSPTELKVRLGKQRHNMAGQSTGFSLQGGGAGSLNIPAFAEDATFMGLGFYRKVSDYSHISLNYNGTKSGNGSSHGVQMSFESKF